MEKRQDKVTEEMVTYLEDKMDELIEEAPELERFILPGGADASASIHIARTVTRRAELLIVSLLKPEKMFTDVVQYLVTSVLVCDYTTDLVQNIGYTDLVFDMFG